jgi:DNA-binding transcriptional ArsR family regulator
VREYGDEFVVAEQYGLWEDNEFARRVFARVRRRGRFMWSKGRPYERYAYVDDAWGKRRSLSRLQYNVYMWARERVGRVTSRMIADSLGVSPSSVSRAFDILQAFGLIHTDRYRGRYGGTWIVRPPRVTWKQRAAAIWKRIKRDQDTRFIRHVRWLIAHNVVLNTLDTNRPNRVHRVRVGLAL